MTNTHFFSFFLSGDFVINYSYEKMENLHPKMNFFVQEFIENDGGIFKLLKLQVRYKNFKWF